MSSGLALTSIHTRPRHELRPPNGEFPACAPHGHHPAPASMADMHLLLLQPQWNSSIVETSPLAARRGLGASTAAVPQPIDVPCYGHAVPLHVATPPQQAAETNIAATMHQSIKITTSALQLQMRSTTMKLAVRACSFWSFAAAVAVVGLAASSGAQQQTLVYHVSRSGGHSSYGSGFTNLAQAEPGACT
jgi:hypothetical protein